MLRAAVIPILALAVPVAAGCGGASSTTSAVESPASGTAATSPSPTGDGCADATVPPARPDGGAKAPKGRLDPGKSYALVFETNCGKFTVTLDLAKAPATAASLVALARSGFYDHTIFHRIVPGFVIQGGDPTQTGSGGPGYETVDPPPPGSTYGNGVVAMAKTAAEPAGTAGSQFFVVTGADVGLPPDYAIVGKVTSGLGVVDRIGELGDPTTEQPTRPVVVESVAVSVR